TVAADVDSGDHDLGVTFGEQRCFADERLRVAAPIGPPGERGRAEGAMFIASVLHAEKRPRGSLRARANDRRSDGKLEGRGDGAEIGPGDDRLHGGKCANSRVLWA